MALNFSEWQESLTNPQYQVEGKEPKCPEGYKYDKQLKTCVPDTSKGHENPGEKECPQSLASYNVIGATGINGDGYAIGVEEAVMFHPSEKEKRKDEERERQNKEQDDRMRYGKSGKPEGDVLRPGEVKKYDKRLKRWVSNKEGK